MRLIVCIIQNHVVHKDKNASQIQMFKWSVIRESSNQENPILWILLKELMEFLEKWAYTLFKILVNKTPSETKLMKAWLGIEIAFIQFQLNLQKLTTTLESSKYNVLVRESLTLDECVSVSHG
jgi:hypothetical protein